MSKTKQILYLAVALALFLSLAACAVGTQEEESTLLEYPGISWEATPEEVIQAMGFPEDRVQTETIDDGYNLGVENWDCFGQEAQRIVFHFAPDEAGRKWIQQIMIFYPEDADMAAVQQAMVAEYGPGVSTYPTSYILPAGVTDMDTTEQNVAVTETVTASAGELFWLSPSVAEYYSPETLQTMHDYTNQQYAQQGEEPLPEAEFSAYWSAQYPVYAGCSTSTQRVFINAYLLQYLQQFETG